MNKSWKSGIGFGVTSAIITTLGLMIGLITSTESRLAVIGGIITIAIADALSDAMGMHLSQEFSGNSQKNVWISTISTFLTKLIIACTFLICPIFLPLITSAIINIIWGLLLLAIFSYIIAKNEKENPFSVIFQHVLIAILVIVLSYFIGLAINSFFMI